MNAHERDPVDRLKSLLGVWYTDSPTWPPGPGIREALRLLDEVDAQHLAATADCLSAIKKATRYRAALEQIAAHFVIGDGEAYRTCDWNCAAELQDIAKAAL